MTSRTGDNFEGNGSFFQITFFGDCARLLHNIRSFLFTAPGFEIV